jgi:hypothetical protein
MTTMKAISGGLTLLGAITGLWAACCWWRASKVDINPGWDFEPVEPADSQGGWITGTMQAFTLSGNLNKKAAFWTGVSVALQALGGITSLLI